MDPISIILVVILALILTKLFAGSGSANKRRKKLFSQGERFDAEIVGVAHPSTILAINGVEPQAGAFGMHNVSSQKQDERMARARVKVVYIDPVTRTREVRHVRIDRRDYTSNRLVKIAVPGTMKLTSSTFKIVQHNKQLFDGYMKDLDSRNLSKEKKKELTNKAMLAMSAQLEKDEEGYHILTPPVKAEGVMLDGKMIFRQVGEDIDYLHDWTKDLE